MFMVVGLWHDNLDVGRLLYLTIDVVIVIRNSASITHMMGNFVAISPVQTLNKLTLHHQLI